MHGRTRQQTVRVAGMLSREFRGTEDVFVNQSSGRVVLSRPTLNMPTMPAYMGRILSSEQIGENKWEYQVERASKALPGYAELSGVPGEFNGTAYNMMENGNSSAGVQGNGVNVDDLPDGFSIGPAPSGDFLIPVYVFLTDGDLDTPAVAEQWFQYPNPVVGRCST